MQSQTTSLPEAVSPYAEPRITERVSVDIPQFQVADLEAHLAQTHIQLALKRAFDISISLILMVLLAPVFLLAAFAVLIESGWPVLFWQERMGWRGKRFLMAKFRSMRTKTDPALAALQDEAAQTGTLLKLENDPRVTRVGKFLRSTSIDELPQLINILKGEMSLVGPRPLIPFMLQPYPEFARARALVRPGVTGLWQVRDRTANTSALCMMPHDLEYVGAFSLWLDLRLLLQTPWTVMKRTGAI